MSQKPLSSKKSLNTPKNKPSFNRKSNVNLIDIKENLITESSKVSIIKSLNPKLSFKNLSQKNINPKLNFKNSSSNNFNIQSSTNEIENLVKKSISICLPDNQNSLVKKDNLLNEENAKNYEAETEKYSLIDNNEKTDNFKVVARFRPLNSVEIDLYNREMGGICVKYNKKDGCFITNSIGFVQTFTLDRIFDSDTNQKTLFDEVAKETINDILKGYNGTIFTYGQSGSGKTHTMYGSNLYDEVTRGIVPRAIEYMFEYINDPVNENIKFQIKFSMLEIYKEGLYDLLNPEVESKDLKIKESKDRQVYVKNLSEEYISNIDEFLLLIDQADKYRVVSETGLNNQSSRSHLLYIIEVLQQLPDGSEKIGKLNLVDLAGSEKISKTGAVGETLEEAKKINLSLSTLGNVISSLSSEKDYVPYRDSKLTRILQDSLGGNYKTTLIVTCSPHMFNSEETAATLKFATRAKKIKNKVKQNIKKSTEELERIIRSLSERLNKANDEIRILKNRISELPIEIQEKYLLLNDNNQDDLNRKNQYFHSDQGEFPSASPLKVYKNQSMKGLYNNLLFSKEDINSSQYFQSPNKIEVQKARRFSKIVLPSEMEKERLSQLSERDEENDSEKVEDEEEGKIKEMNNYLPFQLSNDHSKVINISKVNGNSKSLLEIENNEVIYNIKNIGKVNKDSTQLIERLKKEIIKMRIEKKEEKKKFLSVDTLLSKLKIENEKLIGKITILKENKVMLEEKINSLTSQINSKPNINMEISNIYDILNIIEDLGNKIKLKKNSQNENNHENKDIHLLDYEMNIKNQNLEKENLILKTRINLLENEFIEGFKKMRFFENQQNFLINENEGKDIDSYQSTLLGLKNVNLYNDLFDINEYSHVDNSIIINYKEIIKESKFFLKHIIQFFINKNDFFHSNLYSSSIEETKDKERLINNNVKNGFIKFSSLAILYEKLYFDLLNKTLTDLSNLSFQLDYHKERSSYTSRLPEIFERLESFLTSFKKLKFEEVNLKNRLWETKVFSPTNEDLNGGIRTFHRQNESYKDLIGINTGEQVQSKKNKRSFLKKVTKNIQIKNFNKGSFVKTNNCQNLNMNQIFMYKFSVDNRKSSNNSLPYKRIYSLNDSKDDSERKIKLIKEETEFVSVKSFNSKLSFGDEKYEKNDFSVLTTERKEGNLTDRNNEVEKENEKEKEKINIKINSQKTLYYHTADKYESKAQLYYMENIGKLDNELLLNEIKQLKNEISMYKLYIETINDKLQSETRLKSKQEHSFQQHIHKSMTIFKTETGNLHDCFEIYKKFYEEELDTRKNIIERQSLLIDDIRRRVNESESYKNQSKPQTPLLETPRYSNNFNNQKLFNSSSKNMNTKSNSQNINFLVNIVNNKIYDKDNKEGFREYKESLENDHLFFNSNLKFNDEGNKDRHFHTRLDTLNYSNTIQSNRINISPNKLRTVSNIEDDRPNTVFTDRYYNINRDASLSEKNLASIFYDESGSATKKIDYIKLGLNKDNKVEIEYKNGLNCRIKGKSPISRKFKLVLNGDECDYIINESFD